MKRQPTVKSAQRAHALTGALQGWNPRFRAWGAWLANVVSSVFYSYPPELIAEWCAVSVDTARRWKSGETRPSTTALKLFALYRERRVLGAEWNGWLINANTIVDPEGNATTQGQLRAYYLICQLARELARADQQAQEELRRIIALAG